MSFDGIPPTPPNAGTTDAGNARPSSSRRGPWPSDGGPTRGPADIELELTVRLGTAALTLADVALLSAGQVIELDRFLDDPVDLFLNGQLVARGEVVIENDGPVVVVTDVIE